LPILKDSPVSSSEAIFSIPLYKHIIITPVLPVFQGDCKGHRHKTEEGMPSFSSAFS
jgi:hypothetical protein